MAKTKAEIRAFCESKLGQVCIDKSNHDLNGQCVCFIKNLMEFLGVPNPYAARGNAKDAGDIYIAQGIGTSGRGWLTVCVNRSMGGGYGHIWVDLLNEGNYESNGATPLRVTKNTRPIGQAQQFINFDKWVQGDNQMIIQNADNWYGRCNKTHQLIRGRELSRATFNAYVGRDFLHFVEDCSDDPEANTVQNWQTVGKIAVNDKWQQQIYDLQAALKKAPSTAEIDKAKKQAADLQAQMVIAQKNAEVAEKKSAEMSQDRIESEKVGKAFVLWLGGILKGTTGK